MAVGSVSHLPVSARDQARMFLERADEAQKAADRATAERYIDLAYSILTASECRERPPEMSPLVATKGDHGRIKEMADPGQMM